MAVGRHGFAAVIGMRPMVGGDIPEMGVAQEIDDRDRHKDYRNGCVVRALRALFPMETLLSKMNYTMLHPTIGVPIL